MSDLIGFTKAAEGKKRGSGLGTAMAKHIVQLRRGQGWVKSTLAKQTSFSVPLPQRPS